MAIKYHPMQNYVSKDLLLDALQLEFVNRVNEVSDGTLIISARGLSVLGALNLILGEF